MLLAALGLQLACSNNHSNDSPDDISISGTIFAAAVNGATVKVMDGIGNTVAGPAITNAAGQYSLSVPGNSLNQALFLKSDGGKFTDEVTSETTTAGTMLSFIAANSITDGSTVTATPGSSIIAKLVLNHGKTLTRAQAHFNNTFGYVPNVTINPVNATIVAADDNNAEAKVAGLRAAAFSQLTRNLGLTAAEQFNLLTALAKDLSDGMLDGVDASGKITIVGATTLKADIQNSFSQALLDFYTGTTNKTGLPHNKIGSVPFAKVALTSNYKIEYLRGKRKAKKGKTAFQLRITDKNNGSPATGLSNVKLMPMKIMKTHSRSSAKQEICSESITPGTYNCIIYYVNDSTDSAGYWTLTVIPVTGEYAIFYPQLINIVKGDTTQVKLSGQSGDMVPGKDGIPVQRPYLLFKDGFGSKRTFRLYITSRENMMRYPAVFTGAILNACAVDSDTCKTAHQLQVNTMRVQVSTDTITWIDATDTNNTGHWIAKGWMGKDWPHTRPYTRPSIRWTGIVDDGTVGTIYVKLTVNGELKTSNGKEPGIVIVDGVELDNRYATFTITPNGELCNVCH